MLTDTDLDEMEGLVGRLRVCAISPDNGICTQAADALVTLVAAAREGVRLREALVSVREHFDGVARDKDWLETERLVRAALNEGEK